VHNIVKLSLYLAAYQPQELSRQAHTGVSHPDELPDSHLAQPRSDMSETVKQE